MNNNLENGHTNNDFEYNCKAMVPLRYTTALFHQENAQHTYCSSHKPGRL
jgi:hypothetical protein